MIRAWLCRHHIHHWGRAYTPAWTSLAYRRCTRCGRHDNGRCARHSH